MNTLALYEIIYKPWKDLIDKEGFQFLSEKSTAYSCWIEKGHCAIEIKVERYFDKFDIGFYNLQEKRVCPRSIFSLLETIEESPLSLGPYLLPVSSKYNQSRYYYQRFFLNHPLEKRIDFNGALVFFKEIMVNDFQSILNGDFEFFEKVRTHFLSRPRHDKVSEQEQLALQQDFELYYRERFEFPIEKVRKEIISQIKFENKLSKHLLFEISKEEQAWLDTIDTSKETFGARLSTEYIAAFEKTHGLVLPRDYKLFLNDIGNGFYRFRTLEEALVNNESTTASGCFEFIDLTKEFKVQKETQSTTGSGYLRLYDYGCGIVHYLIVKGEGYGKIWYRNPDFGDMIERYPDYDSWIDDFRDFLNMVIGIYR